MLSEVCTAVLSQQSVALLVKRLEPRSLQRSETPAALHQRCRLQNRGFSYPAAAPAELSGPRSASGAAR